jgi:hypothetical protein
MSCRYGRVSRFAAIEFHETDWKYVGSIPWQTRPGRKRSCGAVEGRNEGDLRVFKGISRRKVEER